MRHHISFKRYCNPGIVHKNLIKLIHIVNSDMEVPSKNIKISQTRNQEIWYLYSNLSIELFSATYIIISGSIVAKMFVVFKRCLRVLSLANLFILVMALQSKIETLLSYNKSVHKNHEQLLSHPQKEDLKAHQVDWLRVWTWKHEEKTLQSRI